MDKDKLSQENDPDWEEEAQDWEFEKLVERRALIEAHEEREIDHEVYISEDKRLLLEQKEGAKALRAKLNISFDKGQKGSRGR